MSKLAQIQRRYAVEISVPTGLEPPPTGIIEFLIDSFFVSGAASRACSRLEHEGLRHLIPVFSSAYFFAIRDMEKSFQSPWAIPEAVFESLGMHLYLANMEWADRIQESAEPEPLSLMAAAWEFGYRTALALLAEAYAHPPGRKARRRLRRAVTRKMGF